MKKSKSIQLIALVMVVMLALVACSKNGGQPAGNDSEGEKTYTIGINKLMDHVALDDAQKGFEDGLKELGINANIVVQSAQGEPANAMTISEKFLKDKVDLVYAIATPSAQASKQVVKDIPVLFSAVTDPVKAEIVADWEDVGGNVTGTSDKADVESQLKMFKEIDPTIETIGIVYNTSEENSKIQIDEVNQYAPAEGLKVEVSGVNNVNDLPQVMDSILKKVDAMYILSDNMVAEAVGLVSKKLNENKVISVSAEESQVQGGILITNGLSYYDLGKKTAEMAKEILVDKKDPSQMPVWSAVDTKTTVNIKSLEALGLDKNLPIFKDIVEVGN